MRDTLRTALGLVAGTAVLLTVAAPAVAAAGDQWWSDVYELDTVHKTTQGEGATVCVIDAAINADVPEFDGAKLELKSAVTTKKDQLVKAKSSPKGFYAAHGTSMTALIIGQGKGTGPGGSGIAGMAPKATVFFYQSDSDPTTSKFDNSDYNLLVEQGLEDGCKIFSISIDNATIDFETLQQVNDEGAVMLWGGRNTSYDAPQDGSLIIGAADRDSQPWNNDKQPLYPDVIAPGVDIISGANKGTLDNPQWHSDYTNSGSSDATAITAGILALVKSKYPDATGNQLIQSLIHSGGGKDYWASTSKLGWGPVSLANMLDRDPSGWPDVNPMLMSDNEVFKEFPESAWKDPNATPTAKPTDNAKAESAAAATPGDDDGLPVWVWPTGVIMLIGAATTAIIARRRNTSSTVIRTGA